MAMITLRLRGDQIGTYTRFYGQGNGAERVVTVEGVTALGPREALYTVIVEQVGDGVEEFRNGQFVTIQGPDGSVVMPKTSVQPDIEQGLGAGDEHLLIAERPFLIDLGGVPAGPETVRYSQADKPAGAGGDDDGNLDFADFSCFAPGTAIATPEGPQDVAALEPGTLVTTRDHGDVPLLWVGRRTLDLTQAEERGKPVLLKPGSMGPDCPARETVVSPDHRILIRDAACDFLFGAAEILAPAKALTGLPRIQSMRGKTRITYVTLFTRRHEIILANGLPVETLYPGPQALRRLGPLLRASLLAACPGIAGSDVGRSYPPARRMLSVTEAVELVTVINARNRLLSPPPAPLHAARPGGEG
ncbi:Hint domain-containing protein [Celeribacter indicus]|uniref:Type I secretion target repeat-containing protein n=1 Tax=Celeribacter indicus TaxID=1208324 RepID=A0A0B5DS78_9RHOB|nr:Hint domain-containing protein [Celeribacter indicus]AJE46383.1 type I secretion target repeat-containing protein [Celeribacter indicus]SDW55241.1 Hint domain-containing protein [Celeribacter indicus]